MRELGKLRRQRVKVDVDVSGALKGLKTLRREADATLKAFERVRDIKYTATTVIQDAVDSEPFAERIRKEIVERSNALKERIGAKRQCLSKQQIFF